MMDSSFSSLSLSEHKQKGNEAYAAGKFELAVKHYLAVRDTVVSSNINGAASEDLKLCILCRSNCVQAYIMLKRFEDGHRLCQDTRRLMKKILNCRNPSHDCLSETIESQTTKLSKRFHKCCLSTGRYEEALRHACVSHLDEEELISLESKVIKVSKKVDAKVVGTVSFDDSGSMNSWCIAPCSSADTSQQIVTFYNCSTSGLHRVALPFNDSSVTPFEASVDKVEVKPNLPRINGGLVFYMRDTDVIVVVDNGEADLGGSGSIFVIDRHSGAASVVPGHKFKPKHSVVACDNDRYLYLLHQESRNSKSMVSIAAINTDPSIAVAEKFMTFESSSFKESMIHSGQWVSNNILYLFGGKPVTETSTASSELWRVNCCTMKAEKVEPQGFIPAGRLHISPTVLPNDDDVLVGWGGLGDERTDAPETFSTGLMYKMSTNTFSILNSPAKCAKPMMSTSTMFWKNPKTQCHHFFCCDNGPSSGEKKTILELSYSDDPPSGLREFSSRFAKFTRTTGPASAVVDPNDNDEYWPYPDPKNVMENPHGTPEEFDEELRIEGNMPLLQSGQCGLFCLGMQHDDFSVVKMRRHFMFPPRDFKPHVDVSHIKGGGMNRDKALKDSVTGVPLRPRIHAWGSALDDDPQYLMERNQFAHQLYGSEQQKQMRPEWRWLQEWSKGRVPRPLPESRVPTTLVLRIELIQEFWTNGEFSRARDPIYRIFTCPSRMSLSTFSFRVLRPVMGWGIRQHTHCFTDCSTGCVFGPMKSDAIDANRKFVRGGYWLDEKAIRLCDILRVPGCEMEYIYDLGDCWTHHIQLQSIVFQGDEKQGPIVMEGKYNCPPENCSARYLHAFYGKRTNNASAAAAVAKERLGLASFDPNRFDVRERNTAVEKAFRDAGDDGSGHFVSQFTFGKSPSRKNQEEELEETRACNPEKIVARNEDGSIGIQGRGSHASDKVCANCGVPPLEHGDGQFSVQHVTCVRCQSVHYCSLVCANADKHRHAKEDKCPGHNWSEAFSRRDRLVQHGGNTPATSKESYSERQDREKELQEKIAALEKANRSLKEQNRQQQSEAPKAKAEPISSDENLCLICCDAKRTWVVQPCGHAVLCDECKRHQGKIEHTGTKKEKKLKLLKECPVCRGAVSGWFKVFL